MAKKKSDVACECSYGMKLQPLGDRVVIRRDESEEKTLGGLYLPDSAKDKPARGVVVSLGDGRVLDDGSRSAFTVRRVTGFFFFPMPGRIQIR